MTFISTKMRARIGGRYLDFAEMLPKFGGGGIHSLQIYREFDRKDAEENRVRTKRVDGSRIRLKAIRLIELFSLEDFDQIEKGFYDLFPTLRVNEFRDSLGSFRSHRDSIGGSYNQHHIGIVVRDSNTMKNTMSPKATLEDLPAGISYIDLGLRQLLPSLVAIVFDVFIDESVTRDLESEQNAIHLPEVHFNNLLPWKVGRTGYWSNTSETVQRRQINVKLRRLRAGVEDSIHNYFRGNFLRAPKQGGPRLPAIEIFFMDGVPYKGDEFEAWEQSARRWLGSYSIGLMFESYRSGPLFLTLPDPFIRDRENNVPHRFIVMIDSFLDLAGQGKASSTRDEDRGLNRILRQYLNPIVFSVAISGFLDEAQAQIESLRKESVNSIRSSVRLKPVLKLQRSILRTGALVDRIRLEFRYKKPWIESSLSDLKDFKLVLGAMIENENLLDHTMKGTAKRLGFLREHSHFIRQAFSDFIGLQNMRRTQSLQTWVILLSIIATIGTVISAVLAYFSYIVSTSIRH